MTSDHAQAVLFLSDHLGAAGYTVISANTDEAADPQLFAQSDSGELAFYFVRTTEPSAADLDRFRALATKHGVAAYRVAVSLSPQPRCLSMTPLS